MTRKGIRRFFFHSKEPSFALSEQSSSPSLLRMDPILEAASSLITKWNPDTSTFACVTSLFYEDKREAAQFMKCVADLQNAMRLLVSEDSTNERLVRAQTLMQIAMKRLQKEFYQMLSMNRAHLDPESVSARSSLTSTRSSTSDFDDAIEEDEALPPRGAGDSISEVEEVSSVVMCDLRSIAECMISSGYAKECIGIYKTIRKSIIDEAIYKLGVEKLTSSRVNKMEWDTLEIMIKNWLEGVKVAMRTLFLGERILCDHVFAGSDSIRESCFSDISRQGALILFGFPELVSKACRKKTSSNHNDRIFRLLDMYTAIAENWVGIESIFSFESTSTVRSQALTSLIKLRESVKSMICDFESNIQKDSSKTVPSGGGLHPLTIHAMNYLILLSDYSNFLVDILADAPPPPEHRALPESYLDSERDSNESSSIPATSVRFAWLVLVLLCKLDRKAENYKDVSLSYLFLANNFQHVVFKVRTSNLQYLLGEDWIAKHEAKVRQFARSYERLAWGPVISSLENVSQTSPEEMKESFKRFNASFEEAYGKQRRCIVTDPKLRDVIKASIGREIGPVYKELYEKYWAVMEGVGGHSAATMGLSPEDVGNLLSDLYFGPVPAHSSPSASSSGSNRRRSR